MTTEYLSVKGSYNLAAALSRICLEKIININYRLVNSNSSSSQ